MVRKLLNWLQPGQKVTQEKVQLFTHLPVSKKQKLLMKKLPNSSLEIKLSKVRHIIVYIDFSNKFFYKMKSPVVPLNWQDLVALNHLVVAVIHLAKILPRFIVNWVLIHVLRDSWRIQLMSKCFKIFHLIQAMLWNIWLILVCKLHFKVDKSTVVILSKLYH